MTGPVRRAVGVDFGTSTSLVAERDGHGAPEVLPLGRSMPGGVARKYVASLAGVRSGLVVAEDAETLPYDQIVRSIKRGITQNRDTIEIATDHGPRSLRVDDVVTAILAQVAQRAEDHGTYLDRESVLRLGCPAVWTGAQRARLLTLAERAGIPVTHASLVDEPVAAGIAWLSHRYLRHGESVHGRILVFDMGGGTLDVAVLDVKGGAAPEVSVLSSIGVPEAGDDLDAAIADELADMLVARGFDLSGPNERARRDQLVREARIAKVRLTQEQDVSIALDPYLFGPDMTLTYTRAQLELAFIPQLSRGLELVWAALRAARLTEEIAPSPMELGRMQHDELAAGIGHVVLAGGMSRIPFVQRMVAQALPKAEVHVGAGETPPEELVVAGLADTTGHDRISMHRPAFDFVLEFDGGHHLLYEAYSPLYQPWRVAAGHSFLGHDWYGTYPTVPREGQGRIRVYTPTEEPVTLNIDGDPVDGLRVEFGSRQFEFKIYCSGLVRICDGKGREFMARVERWPAIRGADHELRVVVGEMAVGAEPVVAWYFEDRPHDRLSAGHDDTAVGWYPTPSRPDWDRWHTEPELTDDADPAYR